MSLFRNTTESIQRKNAIYLSWPIGLSDNKNRFMKVPLYLHDTQFASCSLKSCISSMISAFYCYSLKFCSFVFLVFSKPLYAERKRKLPMTHCPWVMDIFHIALFASARFFLHEYECISVNAISFWHIEFLRLSWLY
jgi:hypothetical protein